VGNLSKISGLAPMSSHVNIISSMLNEAAHHNPESQIMAKSLESLGKQHGYKIKVLDLGTSVPHFEDPKLNQIAEALSDFLTAPTIKDEFGHEHHKRRNFCAEEFNAMTDNEKVRTTNTIARTLKTALHKFKN